MTDSAEPEEPKIQDKMNQKLSEKTSQYVQEAEEEEWKIQAEAFKSEGGRLGRVPIERDSCYT